jgi:hypothetical protein
MIGKTTGRPRPVDIRDAREQGLLPGVSSILKCLHKEALVNWMIEQACLAVITTPRKQIKIIEPVTGLEKEVVEELDAFIERVLHVEKVQDEESQIARDRGTDIHNALEALFSGQAQPISEELKPWVMPAYEAVKGLGEVITTEQILVGDGYAGRTDLILGRLNPESYTIWDFKSAGKLPSLKKGGAYPEHRLQLSAYARAFLESAFAADKFVSADKIRTANLYISTKEQGQFVICEHEEWQETFLNGFLPLVQYWSWANKFQVSRRLPPPQPVAEAPAETAMLETALAEAKTEANIPVPGTIPADYVAPRKRKVSVDVGVPTLQQPRLSPMVPPNMPLEP